MHTAKCTQQNAHSKVRLSAGVFINHYFCNLPTAGQKFYYLQTGSNCAMSRHFLPSLLADCFAFAIQLLAKDWATKIGQRLSVFSSGLFDDLLKADKKETIFQAETATSLSSWQPARPVFLYVVVARDELESATTDECGQRQRAPTRQARASKRERAHAAAANDKVHKRGAESTPHKQSELTPRRLFPSPLKRGAHPRLADSFCALSLAFYSNKRPHSHKRSPRGKSV